ncbi:hypothetical protein Xmau_04041 [Xenorhabdus mauleonii]|uniref:Virulence-associated protein n=1 Tax=Xenorhabdus mauleonii TaxID=351675 RepID=A0A1I3VZG0_9GAMM|nr:VapA/VapB family virulence-associated protein [Xenorhabdus mauleonii]PHM36894.1 hypothetical protein Xmau_04041 [Xenorhabdus mauleonii]SFK00519.1 virulence-associated protein [Xenorhabdus mauleonii]
MMKVNNIDHSVLNNYIKDDLNKRFFQDMRGREIDPVLIANPAEKILISTQEEKADAFASMISEIIYFRLNVTVENSDRTFNGQGWSLNSIGVGGFTGGIYSDDLTFLYMKAHSFWFYEVLTLIFIAFYDDESTYLGTFRGSGISSASGIGSGTGIFY